VEHSTSPEYALTCSTHSLGQLQVPGPVPRESWGRWHVANSVQWVVGGIWQVVGSVWQMVEIMMSINIIVSIISLACPPQHNHTIPHNHGIDHWTINSVGIVENWNLGRADLGLRFSSRIYCVFPTHWGHMCVYSKLMVMMVMMVMVMMAMVIMVIVMMIASVVVITVPEALRQASWLC